MASRKRKEDPKRGIGFRWGATMSLMAIVAFVAGCGGDGGSDAVVPGVVPGVVATPTASAGTSTPGASLPAGAPSSNTPSPSPEDTSSTQRVSSWTSQPLRVDHNPAVTPLLVAVRSAHHEELGYDRLVFEFEGQVPGYDIRYVPEVLTPGEGAPLTLRGQAFIEVVFYPAAAHDDAGSSTMRTSTGGGGLPGLHEYQMAGDFEGYVHYGLGVDDVVGFRVTEFANPSRVAIDIAA